MDILNTENEFNAETFCTFRQAFKAKMNYFKIILANI